MLTLDERLKFCRACKNRKTNMQIGLVCKLTDQKPDFVIECPHFDLDQAEATRLAKLEKSASEEDSGGFFAPEKKGIQKGVIGGVVMMIIAAIWFIAGWSAGIMFYYPPILFLIGVYAFFRGAATGNISGKQK